MLVIPAALLAYTQNNHTDCIHLNTAWLINSSLLLANSHILIQPISNNLYVTMRLWLTSKDSSCLTWQFHGGGSLFFLVLYTLPT